MDENIKISEIKKGIELSIENSFELIGDANILFDNGKYARCYSLTQLSLEELGKSIMLYDFYMKLQLNKRKEIDFKKFRRDFRDHRLKTFESIFIEFQMKGKGKTELSEIKDNSLLNFGNIQKNKEGYYDNLKNNSLYVSLKNDKFYKPNELFNKPEVKTFLSESKLKIEFSSSETLKWLRMDEFLGTDKEGILGENKKI
ncbi:MAG TPA: AbiV family abortive infection protein [Lutibacter sp.]